MSCNTTDAYKKLSYMELTFSTIPTIPKKYCVEKSDTWLLTSKPNKFKT